MGREGRVSWRKQLAHRRRDSQSGHSLMARFPQLEHAWRSNEEGGTCDKRYHRDGVLCCIRYSPCRVVFQSVLRARLLLEREAWSRDWLLHRNDAQVILVQMMTRVGLGTTCYPSSDDDTCRVGCESHVQSVTAWREKKPRYKGKLNRICRGTFITAHCFGLSAL